VRQRTQLNIPLYEGQDDDLLAWWATLAHGPHGAKIVEVKAALRRGLTSSEKPGQTVSVAPASLDLAAIRQVVEAAMMSVLAYYGPLHQGAIPDTKEEGQNGETANLLADLDTALLLE
jgi:hypothetical protein